MQTYESILITIPTLTEEEEKTTVDLFDEIITEGGGSIDYRDRMGKRRLAYPILKLDDGVYTRFLYDAEATVVTEFERRARLDDKVMRYMTVKLERTWAREAKEKAVLDIQARKDAVIAAAEAAVAAEAAKIAAVEAAKIAAEEAAAEALANPPAKEQDVEPAIPEEGSTVSAEATSPEVVEETAVSVKSTASAADSEAAAEEG